MSDFIIEEGLPYPLGAQWSGKGTNFAIFSANASKVEVCLFDGDREVDRFELPEYTDQVFHGFISGVGPGTRYGYRVYAPINRTPAIASTPTSCCSTPMRVPMPAH